MKTAYLFINLSVVILMFTACSKDEGPVDAWDGRLYLSSDVATQTRGNGYWDDKIVSGEEVWLYVDKASDDTQLYGRTLTSLENNNFIGADNMYFPGGEENINFYAFHINATRILDMPTHYPSDMLTHHIDEDQEYGSLGYPRSDLLYAKESLTKEKAKEQGGAVTLTFKHALSKIAVYVYPNGWEASGITVSRIEILNTKLKGTFTPSKTDQDITVMASGDVIDGNPIRVDCKLSNSGAVYPSEAIIIPQTIAKGTPFIRIIFTHGGELIYKLDDGNSSTDSVTFAAGVQYNYIITGKLTDLVVTSNIERWNSGSTGSGESSM